MKMYYGTHQKWLGDVVLMCTHNIPFNGEITVAFVLLNLICPAFTNSVDPDQLASEEAN